MTDATSAHRPLPRYREIPDRCPKCGRKSDKRRHDETWYHGPTYLHTQDVLTWACARCGFMFATATLDAKDPLQGWTP